MLFQYTYPVSHTLGLLNGYLLHFVAAIQKTNKKSKFIIDDYFDSEFVDILKESPKLIEKFKVFFESFRALDLDKKEQFHKILTESQDFESVFSDESIDCSAYKTEEIEKLIGNSSFKDLADFLFTYVKYERWDIKGHYDLIYKALDYKICPFCGVHPLHKTFREDYDHLAPKSIYPLVSVNPKNLAPMCHDCNSKNKGSKDILHASDGKRNLFIYPYTQHVEVRLNFKESIIPQTDTTNPKGNWEIIFHPENSITENWDNIFNIKKRYLVDFVIPNYETWLKDFITDCIEDNIDLNNIEAIKFELLRFGNRFQRKWYDQANIIKGPLFQFLANCENELFYNSIRSMFNRMVNTTKA